MKAFARSLRKLGISRELCQKINSLFGILVNSTNLSGGLDLFDTIIKIFADPALANAETLLNFSLNKNDVEETDLDVLLERNIEDEKEDSFLDEMDVSNDRIIHRSPFSVIALTRSSHLNAIIRKQNNKVKVDNQLFSIPIVQLLYKWFAYFPLWSSVLTNFIERYCRMM